MLDLLEKFVIWFFSSIKKRGSHSDCDGTEIKLNEVTCNDIIQLQEKKY